MSLHHASIPAGSVQLMKTLTGNDHPTPVHITNCIRDEIHEAAFARGEFAPQWVLDCIDRGRLRSCAEYDQETVIVRGT